MSTALVAAVSALFPGDPHVQALRNALPNYKAAERVVMGMMRTAMTNERKMIGLTKAWHKFQTWHRLGGGNVAASRKRGRQPGLLNMHSSFGWHISSHLNAKDIAMLAQVRKANSPFANVVGNQKTALMRELKDQVARGRKALKKRKWRDALQTFGAPYTETPWDGDAHKILATDTGKYFESTFRTTRYNDDPRMVFAMYTICLRSPKRFIAHATTMYPGVYYVHTRADIMPNPPNVLEHIPQEWRNIINSANGAMPIIHGTRQSARLRRRE